MLDAFFKKSYIRFFGYVHEDMRLLPIFFHTRPNLQDMRLKQIFLSVFNFNNMV